MFKSRFFGFFLCTIFTSFTFAAGNTIFVPDECAFIRTALNNLPEEGGTVTIPAGKYVCHAPIVVDRDNTTLTGEGDVTLVLADHINAPVIVMGQIQTPPENVNNIEVSHIKIDGNRRHQDMECWGGPCDSGGTAYIRNNGISVRGLSNSRILDVFVTGARSGGVVTERHCSGLLIDGLSVTDSFFDGFAGYETTGSLIQNLNLFDNPFAGLSIDIRFQGNTFKNVRATNNDLGIFMRDSNNNVFENFTIENSRNHGIFLAVVEHPETCPTGNEFRNLAITGSGGFGFMLNNACPHNRLTGPTYFAKNRLGCLREDDNVKLEVQGKLTCEN